MFETNGDFGKTRFADANNSPQDKKSLFCASRIFWHDCNDHYGLTREHGADNHLVLLSIAGCGLLDIEGNRHILKNSTTALIPPGKAHSYRCAPGSTWTFYGVHILNNFAGDLIGRIASENGRCFTHADPQAGADLLEHMMLNIKNDAAHCNFRNSLLLSEFLHGLFYLDLTNQDVRKAASDNKKVGLFEQALAYLEQNYAKPIDIDALSSRLFLSPSHFIRIFKQYFAMTPYLYLERYRILQARILLCQTQMRVSGIAAAVGYKSTSNFILYFKKHIGVTPTAYRKDPKRYEYEVEHFLKQMTYSPLRSGMDSALL